MNMRRVFSETSYARIDVRMQVYSQLKLMLQEDASDLAEDLTSSNEFLVPNVKKHFRRKSFSSSKIVVNEVEAISKDLSNNSF